MSGWAIGEALPRASKRKKPIDAVFPQIHTLLAVIYDRHVCIGYLHQMISLFGESWSPSEDQKLERARENEIPYDKFAVVIVLNKVTVGHLPKEISKTVSFFFKHGAEAMCTVNGRSRHSEITEGFESFL